MGTQQEWFLERFEHDPSLPSIPRISAVWLAAISCTTGAGESIALHMAEHGGLWDKQPGQLLAYLEQHFPTFWDGWHWVNSSTRRQAVLGTALRRAVHGNDLPAYEKPGLRGPKQPKIDPNGQMLLNLPSQLIRGM